MKNLPVIASLFIAPMLLLSAAPAQLANSGVPDQLPVSIAFARCQYTPRDEACLSWKESDAVNSEKSPDGSLAQMPRQIPRAPRLSRRPPGPYPRTGYPRLTVPEPNVRHAAIGFLIGFTLGVLHPNDRTAGNRVALGLICGALGAVIGAAVPSFSSHHRYPAGSWPDDDDEIASRSKVAPLASPEPVSADAATAPAAPTSPAEVP